MNQTETNLCNRMIDQLTQIQFGIPSHFVERFGTLINQAEVIHVKGSGKKIRLPLPNGEWAQTLDISQVIDVPPEHWEKRQCEGRIVLVLADVDEPLSEWTIIHELCHLLSIRPYEKVRQGWRHSYGINEFLYQVKNGQMVCQALRHDAMNELMTDLAVWVLQKNGKGEQKAPYHGLSVFADYAKTCVPGRYPLEQLVGGYFSGQTEQIRRWLLNEQWESYEELNTALRMRCAGETNNR